MSRLPSEPPLTRDAFLALIRNEAPHRLARRFLGSESVAAFPNPEGYAAFRRRVATTIAHADIVLIAGSGNWQFSLHPEKAFKEFDARSDIDVAVVSPFQFNRLWAEMRRLERLRWYRLSDFDRTALRRNSENVYAGFISPLWLPDDRAAERLAYRRLFNSLSDRTVGFRSVRMFFFKTMDEAVSYYERGFTKARRELK